MKYIDFLSLAGRLYDARMLSGCCILDNAKDQELDKLYKQIHPCFEELTKSIPLLLDNNNFFHAEIQLSEQAKRLVAAAREHIQTLCDFEINDDTFFQPVFEHLTKVREELFKIFQTEAEFIQKCHSIDMDQIRTRIAYWIENKKEASIGEVHVNDMSNLFEKLDQFKKFSNPLQVTNDELAKFSKSIFAGIELLKNKIFRPHFMNHINEQSELSLSLGDFSNVIEQIRTCLLKAWAKDLLEFQLDGKANELFTEAKQNLTDYLKENNVQNNSLYTLILAMWRNAGDNFTSQHAESYQFFEKDYQLLILDFGGIIALPTRRSATYELLMKELNKLRRWDAIQEFAEERTPELKNHIQSSRKMLNDMEGFINRQLNNANDNLQQQEEGLAKSQRRVRRLAYLDIYLEQLADVHKTQTQRRAKQFTFHDRMSAKILYCETMDSNVKTLREDVLKDNIQDNFNETLCTYHYAAKDAVAEKKLRKKDIHKGINSTLKNLNHTMIYQAPEDLDTLSVQRPQIIIS